MPSTSSRAGTVPLVGGRPCIDLVNTVSWRGDPDRRTDHLQTPADGLVWCRRAGVIDDAEAERLGAHLAAEPSRGVQMLAGLRHLRTAIAEHLVDPDSPDPSALGPLVLDALRASHLRAGDRRARWVTDDLDEHTPVVRLTLDLHEQLTQPRGVLDTCDDPACAWAYLDTSKSHNRRWCRSSDCGNRERVRRHSARADRRDQG